MHYLLDSHEMKRCDETTIKYFQISSNVLMERAALSVFDEIAARFSPSETCLAKFLIVCGAGNNGGDGLAVARLLHLAGYHVEILLPMDKEKMTPETKAQYQSVKRYHITEIDGLTGGPYTAIVDALFGIGLSRKVEGKLEKLLGQLNEMKAYKIAVDIPSGVMSDSGQILGAAFHADLTVTFGFAKIGQLLYPGADYTGKLLVRDIGITEHSFQNSIPFGKYVTHGCISQLLPRRTARSNKGTYGKALIIAGSAEMAGAAYFAAKAAYYSGCGLVRILTSKENKEILLTKLPEAILSVYDGQSDHLQEPVLAFDDCADWADAILIGPGLGSSPAAQMLVAKALSCGEKKVVFDADALNILSRNMALFQETPGVRVITPHLKEMSRLCSKNITDIQRSLLETAREFARDYQAVCVLKDARTVTSLPNGDFFVNTTGNHGMATGGCGDVLAGFLTGFLAQGMEPKEAAPLAVFLHGWAGDLAAAEKGERGMLAGDVLEMLPAAILASERGAER